MKNIIAVAVASLLIASPAMAWNPLQDVADQVQQDVKAQAAQTQAEQTGNGESAVDQMSVEAKRKALGKKAKGKSDAEVNALYEKKMAKGQAIAEQAKSASTDGGAAVKAQATEQAQTKTREKTHEATQKGFDKLNKALGQ
ncbi:MAG: hypothetical protein R3F47_00200 [Gammaproteobacteria bacterium]|jgi:hypothetical protein